MKNAIFASLCAFLLSMGFALSGTAGSIVDTDSDLVPDVFDNCVTVPNGPGGGACSNQEDFDDDGFGNACDGDFDQDGNTLGSDFTLFLGFFGNPGNAGDLDCDGQTLGSDFTIFLGLFGSPPG